MSIKVVCPQCGHSLSAPDHFAGKVAGCPACKTKIKVPSSNSRPAAVAPTSPTKTSPANSPPVKPAPQQPPRATPLSAPRPTPVAPPVRPAVSGLPALPAQHAASAGGDLPFSLDDGIATGSAYSGYAFPDLTSGTPSTPPPPQANLLAAKKKQKSNLLLYIAAASAGVLVIVGITAFFVLRGSSSGSGVSLRYVPDETDMLVRIGVAAGLKSTIFQKLKDTIPNSDPNQKFFETNIAYNDIASVIATESRTTKDGLFIVSTKRACQESDLGSNFKSEKVGTLTILTSENGFFASCLIDEHMVLHNPPKSLRQVLSRTRDAKLSPAFVNAMSNANFSSTLCGVLSGKAISDFKKDVPTGPLPMDITAINGLVIEGDFSSAVDLRAAMIYADADKAKQFKRTIDEFLPLLSNPDSLATMFGGMTDDAKPIIDNIITVAKTINISQSGTMLRGKISFSEQVLEALSKLGPSMIPGRGDVPLAPAKGTTKTRPPLRPNTK